MLARIEAIGAAHDVRIANIAHAGDGNLHPLLSTRPATTRPATAPCWPSTRSSPPRWSWAAR